MSGTSDRSVQAIIKALTDSPIALTKTRLSQVTGLSYNTIKTHIDSVGANRIISPSGNVTYSLSGTNVDSGIKLKWRNSAAGRKSGQYLKVDMLDMPDAVGLYERLASRIPLALPNRIRPDDDPAELAEAISQYAVFLATIAAKLQTQQDNPEWFTQLGGDDGYFPPQFTALN